MNLLEMLLELEGGVINFKKLGDSSTSFSDLCYNLSMKKLLLSIILISLVSIATPVWASEIEDDLIIVLWVIITRLWNI